MAILEFEITARRNDCRLKLNTEVYTKSKCKYFCNIEINYDNKSTEGVVVRKGSRDLYGHFEGSMAPGGLFLVTDRMPG